MAVSKENLVVDQGASLQGDWQWIENGDPKDLTGFTAYGHIRRPLEASTILLDLSDWLTVVPAEGRVVLDVPSTETEELDWVGPANFDILLDDGSGTAYRLVQGRADLSKAVTRDYA